MIDLLPSWRWWITIPIRVPLLALLFLTVPLVWIAENVTGPLEDWSTR